MSTSTLHPTSAKIKAEPQQNEAQPELQFANLPPNLQKDLQKSEAKGVHVRAWVVAGLRGQCAAALVLSQYMYWSVRSENGPGGAFWISIAQIKKQTGLGRGAYDNAHAKLKKLGFCNESFDLFNKRTVCLNWQRILALFEATQQSTPFAGNTLKPFAGNTLKGPLLVIPPKLEIPRDSLETLSHADAFAERVDAIAVGDQGTASEIITVAGDAATPTGRKGGKGKQSATVTSLPDRKKIDGWVCDFYEALGCPTITQPQFTLGRPIIADMLKAGHTPEDVALVIDRVRSNPTDDRGDPITSIGILPHLIGKVVAEAKKRAEAEREQRAAEKAEEIRRDEAAREAREKLKKNMPSWMPPIFRKKIEEGDSPTQPAQAQPDPHAAG